MTNSEIRDSFTQIHDQIPGPETVNSILESLNVPSVDLRAAAKKIFSCLDLTSLKPTDTKASINALISKARLKLNGDELQVAALCVFQPFIGQCTVALAESGIGVATVAGGFPGGQMDVAVKCADVEKSAQLGATEIDVVINRTHVLEDDWAALFNEVSHAKQAAGKAKLKVILATGELPTLDNIAKASWVSMMAGADFIKTSTGLEKVNATLEAGIVMARMIRVYHVFANRRVGLKPAGGISTVEQATKWLSLVHRELGEEWVCPRYFRIGASSLLTNIEEVLFAPNL